MDTPVTQANPRPRRGSKRWPPPRKNAANGEGRTRRGILGIAWVHGVFCAGVYKRNNRIAGWNAPEPVHTLDEFAAALDAALEALRFRGVEAFLVLEHPELKHLVEKAPAFSERAARTYLKNLMRRRSEEGEPLLWDWQRLSGSRDASVWQIHQLPRRFYDSIDEILLARRLELDRLHPFSTAVQQLLLKQIRRAGKPILIACRAGDATALAIGNERGEPLLSRTTISTWETNPDRVALEINRSLLFARQQFGIQVERVLFAGFGAETAVESLRARFPGEQETATVLATPLHWLDAVRQINRRQSADLLTLHLRRRRRYRIIRSLIVTGGWLLLGAAGWHAYDQARAWQAERAYLENLGRREASLRETYEALAARDAELAEARAFLTAVNEGQLPPLPGKFLVYLASLLPTEARLTEFSVEWDPERLGWKFAFDGTIEADESTARQAENQIRRQLTQGPFRARLAPQAAPGSVLTFGGQNTGSQRFTLEGTIFEN